MINSTLLWDRDEMSLKLLTAFFRKMFVYIEQRCESVAHNVIIYNREFEVKVK
jgi:hypothetical protein